MKKQFRSQASSGRAVSGAAFGGGFGTSTFGTTNSPLSYVYEPPDLSGIADPNVVVIFKNLMKRDSTTKAKALEDLQSHLTPTDVVIEEALLSAWVKLYPRLSIDTARRVRQLSHILQGQIAAQCGKRMLKYMGEMAGPWLAGAQDSDRGAARAAQEALKHTFNTTEKLANLSKVFQQPILEYCKDAITNETVQTLSDERTVSADDAEATYARVIGTSLAVVSNLLVDLSQEELGKQQETYDAFLDDSRLWNFASHKDVSVRRGLFRLTRACLDKQKPAVEHGLRSISTAFIDKALHSDQTGSSLDLVQSLVALTISYPGLWTSEYTGKKAASSRLRQYVKRGSQNSPAEFWQVLWSLFDQVPHEVFPKEAEEVRDLLKGLHEGVTHRDERFNAGPAWETYFRVVDLVSRQAQLSEEAQEWLMDDMVMPAIEQYLRPSDDNTKWAPAGSKPAQTVAKSAYCHRLRITLQKRWPLLVDQFLDDIKSSYPEQSKEFDRSQTSIAAAGDRWAELQSELSKTISDTDHHMPEVFKSATVKIVQECLKILQLRNGKPYGAAAVVDSYFHHCSKMLLDSQDTSGQLFEFLLQDAPKLLNSPCQRQLLSLLYRLSKDSRFEQAWTVIADAIIDMPESPEKLNAFRELLSAPRVMPAADIAASNPRVQNLLTHQYKIALDTREWSLISSNLKPSAKVASNGTQVAILTGLIGALSVENQHEAALDGLEQIAQNNPELVKAQMSHGDGSQLLPRLLLLEASVEERIAKKAAHLSKLLVQRSSAVENQVAAFDVVKDNLSKISADSLPVEALCEMTLRLMDQQQTPTLAPALPDLTIWEESLVSLLSQLPPASTSITSSLGGAIHLLSRSPSPGLPAIATDSEGYSQALRFAMFTTRTLRDSHDFGLLDESHKMQVLQNLALTVQVANDNLTIAGTNRLWVGRDAEIEAEIVELVSRANTLITSCMELASLRNQPSDFVMNVLDRFSNDSMGLDGSAFFNARASEWCQSWMLNRTGCSRSEAEDLYQALHEHRKTNQILHILSLQAAYGDALWSHSKVDRYCNELVADLTGLDLERQPEKTLERLVIFNVLTHHSWNASVIAKQRIIFCVKHIMQWLFASSATLAIKSETYKALSSLLPHMSDMYGEHWSDILKAITETWSAGLVLEDSGRLNEGGLPAIHASLDLYGRLRRIEEPNDDLVDALKAAETTAANSLLQLLISTLSLSDQGHQPLEITLGLLERRIMELSIKKVQDASTLYPLICASSQSVSRAAYLLLHKHIIATQEEVSFDAALEKKEAHLPEELLSLVLTAPTLESLADVSFEQFVPLDLQAYLYSWLLIFDHFTNSSYAVKTTYIEDLKDASHVAPLLDLVFDFLGHTIGKPISEPPMSIDTWGLEAAMGETPERQTQHLLAHLYYLALTHAPSLVKSYYLSLTSRQTSLAIESWTAKHVSPLIIANSLSAVTIWAQEQEASDPEFAEKMTVRVATRSKEVNVSYLVDEQRMAIVVRLPETYPLNGARVEGVSRVAVDEKRWASWLRNCQGVITFSNGNLIDGLSAWRKNVVGALKGQTECAICYSIISGDKQLPSKRCGTCKNLFHSSCLYKWFKTSNASSCPLCRNAFNYG